MQIKLQEARFYVSLVLDEAEMLGHKWIRKKTSGAIQLCLERHLSIPRESGGGDERGCYGRRDRTERERWRCREGRQLLCLKSHSIISATSECIMQMGHSYCLNHLYVNV